MLRSTRQTNDLNVDKIQKIAALAAASVWLGLLLIAFQPLAGIALALTSTLLMLCLNLSFFKLLKKQGGLKLALASLGLMNLYYLVCLTSYATAITIWLMHDRLGMMKSKSIRPPYPYSNHIAESTKNKSVESLLTQTSSST